MAKSKGKTAKSTLDYMVGGIRYVCEHYKDRAPGTPSERKAQEYFKKELGKFSDEVTMEDFDLHPNAFMGFIIIAGLLTLLSILFYWLAPSSVIYPLLGAVLTLFSILMFLFEFLMYRSFADFLFPKRVSRNVMAVRRPLGEAKRRIIFGGHADAANEWTYSYHGQMKTLAPVMSGSIIGMFAVFGFNFAITVKSFVTGIAGIDGVWKALGIVRFVSFRS